MSNSERPSFLFGQRARLSDRLNMMEGHQSAAGECEYFFSSEKRFRSVSNILPVLTENQFFDRSQKF